MSKKRTDTKIENGVVCWGASIEEVECGTANLNGDEVMLKTSSGDEKTFPIDCCFVDLADAVLKQHSLKNTSKKKRKKK